MGTFPSRFSVKFVVRFSYKTTSKKTSTVVSFSLQSTFLFISHRDTHQSGSYGSSRWGIRGSHGCSRWESQTHFLHPHRYRYFTLFLSLVFFIYLGCFLFMCLRVFVSSIAMQTEAMPVVNKFQLKEDLDPVWVDIFFVCLFML